MVTEMSTREQPAVITQTPSMELQVRLIIKMPSERVTAPRTLTVLLPLLAVASPATGADTTNVPVIRLEVSPPPAGCWRRRREQSWSSRNKVRQEQELLTTVNIPGLPRGIFSAISSLLKLPYVLLSASNKGLLSILNFSFLWQ